VVLSVCRLLFGCGAHPTSERLVILRSGPLGTLLALGLGQENCNLVGVERTEDELDKCVCLKEWMTRDREEGARDID